MKGLGILLALAFVVVSASGEFDHGLKVKFNLGLTPWSGKDFFYNVERTISEAIKDGWELTERPEGPRPSLVLYCPEDFILCGFFDKDTGIIAGLLISLPEKDFTDSPFDWGVQGFTQWSPAARNGHGNELYWSIAQFFVSEEYLEKSVQERIDSRIDDKVLQEDAVWVTGFNGELDRISVHKSDIEKSIFTKQACIPWMGHHYYYNMSSTTPCKANTLYPWFPLVASNELRGLGFVVIGKLPIKQGNRDWFERPPATAVKVIVPRGPQCLYDLAETVGLVTMHVYFIEKPWTLTCLFQ